MYFPRFRISNKTLVDVARIEAAKELIGITPLVSSWEMKLREEVIVKQILFSLRVEGNGLDQHQIEKIIQEDPLRGDVASEIGARVGIRGRESEVQEVMNLRNGLKIIDQWIVMQRRRGGSYIYSKELLLQIETLILEKLVSVEEIGEWRKEQLGEVGMGNFVFRPPNAVEVSFQINDLFAWLNTREARELHPVLKVAITDFELSRVYPFRTKSNVITRAFVFFMLAIEGLSERRLVGLEEVRSENLLDWYQALVQAEKEMDLTAWMEMWSELLRDETEKTKQKVRRLTVDLQVQERLNRQIALNERQINLISYMEAKDWITLIQMRAVFAEVSDDTILRDLKGLIKKGLVRKKGRTKGAKYILKSLIR